MNKEIRRGDVVYVDLDPARGSEKKKKRPCLVIQNNIGNKYSPLTIVAVITSQKEISKPYPTDVWINKGEGGMEYASIIQCDLIRTIDKTRILKQLGSLNDLIMSKVNKALAVSLDMMD
jgi:mRNA interferase MazF